MSGPTWTPDLVLADETLFDTFYSFEARLVLAVQLGYPNHNPSLEQIAAVAAMNRHTVLAAQAELETTFSVWTDNGDGIQHVGGYQLAALDRPSAGRDRRGSYPRFNRSTRVEKVARWADPRDPANGGRWGSLPGAILERLPRGRKNNALIRLAALAYAREQLRAGAIQIGDDALAYLLGSTPRKIGSARRLLAEAGILRFVRRDRPCNIYTMPGGTPGRPENPDALDPLRTRRLDHLHVGPHTLRVYASANELAEATRLIDTLTPPLALLALRAGIPWSLSERLHGPEILDALASFHGRQKGQVSGSKHPYRPLRAPLPVVRGTEPLLPTPNSTFTRFAREEEAGEGEASLSGLPKVAAELAALYPEGAPRSHLDSLDWTRTTLGDRFNDGQPLNTDQLAALDSRLAGFLAGLDPTKDPRLLFAQVRRALRHPTTDDALFAELQRLATPLDASLAAALEAALPAMPE